MIDSGSDFSGVRVGDRLWLRTDCYSGWAYVTDKKVNATYPIVFEYDNNGLQYRACITLSGCAQPNGPQVLFWDKVEIVPPSKPKRLVKKTVEVRPFRYEGKIYFKSGEDLRPGAELESIFCGPIQPITVEVEE